MKDEGRKERRDNEKERRRKNGRMRRKAVGRKGRKDGGKGEEEGWREGLREGGRACSTFLGHSLSTTDSGDKVTYANSSFLCFSIRKKSEFIFFSP